MVKVMPRCACASEVFSITKGVQEKRACNSPRAKTEWAEECYWKSTVISKNRFLLNRVLSKYR